MVNGKKPKRTRLPVYVETSTHQSHETQLTRRRSERNAGRSLQSIGPLRRSNPIFGMPTFSIGCLRPDAPDRLNSPPRADRVDRVLRATLRANAGPIQDNARACAALETNALSWELASVARSRRSPNRLSLSDMVPRRKSVERVMGIEYIAGEQLII
jgi:hypothetical protein